MTRIPIPKRGCTQGTRERNKPAYPLAGTSHIPRLTGTGKNSNFRPPVPVRDIVAGLNGFIIHLHLAAPPPGPEVVAYVQARSGASTRLETQVHSMLRSTTQRRDVHRLDLGSFR